MPAKKSLVHCRIGVLWRRMTASTDALACIHGAQGFSRLEGFVVGDLPPADAEKRQLL